MSDILGATTTESADEFIKRNSAAWSDEKAAPIHAKDIGRRGKGLWVREAWTFLVQHNYAEKVLVIERMRFDSFTGETAHEGGAEVGEIEYRFGYFIVGRIGRAAGRWVWAQFSPFIPQEDLVPLLRKAIADGTLRIPTSLA